jgi:hypothetical protein
MARAATEAAVASRMGDARERMRSAPEAATAAWLCALPCAAIAAVAIYLLGPPLGGLFPHGGGSYTFLASQRPFVRPEPTEQGRYLIALCAPPLGLLAIASAPRWLSRAPPRVAAWTVVGTQVALVGIVVASIVVQYRLRFGFVYSRVPKLTFTLHYFSPATLVVATLLAGGTAAALRSERTRRRAASALRVEPRRRRLIAGAVAVAFTAIWMLDAIHSDREIGNAAAGMRYHLGFTLDETFAVLDGRTPLVDFSAQYGSLWPFAVALSLLAFGKTVLAFTLTLCTITAVALLAVYGVLRRATRSATAALLLFMPFLATSLFQTGGTMTNRSSVASYYAAFPLRYSLPLLLAWLTARQLDRRNDDGRGGTARWLLFTVAGLAVLNNVDFGIAALGGSVAALLWTTPEALRRPALLRLAASVAGGLATAVGLVTLLTVVRAGALPRLARLLDYARLYAIGGYSLMPIPSVLGVHLLIFLTYVAAILAATVRASRGAGNRVLTGMLAWAGVFGLGAGMYYVGRSHPVALKYEFSAWALALALLTILAVRELAVRRLRRTAIAAFVVLFGFGLAACSLAQTPTPWGQIERLQASFVPTEQEPDAEPLAPSQDARTRRFVTSLADGPSRFVVKAGAPVAILLTTGHRVADAYGVVDVSPYTGIESIFTVQRVEATLDALRNAGGNTAILPIELDWSIVPVLERRGFRVLTPYGLHRYVAGRTRPVELLWPGGDGIMKWVDMRHLRPRALR